MSDFYFGVVWNVLSVLASGLGAVWIYWDATKNGIGRVPDKHWFNFSAGWWAVGMLFLWFVFLPVYFIMRNKLIARAKESPIEVKHRSVKLGALVFITILSVVGISGLYVAEYPEVQKEIAISDVSGVWSADSEDTLITIKLNAPNKSITIRENVIPVSIKDYDSDNHIITLVVNSNPSMIWSIRQFFDKDGGFTIRLTLHTGATDSLSFVRGL